MSSQETTPPPVPAPSPAPRPPAPDPGPRRSPFPLILAVIFLAVVVAAFVIERALRPPPKPESAAPATAAVASPDAAATDEVKGLREKVDALASKVDALTNRVEAMPKPEPPPDVAPLRERIDELAKSVESVPDAAKKAEAAGATVAENAKAIDGLRSDVEMLKSEVAALKSKPAASAPEAQPEPANTTEVTPAALASAAQFFRSGKYAEARDAFRKLPANDARVLYYDALSTGFAANKWDGEAADLATKGAQAEKAGNPSKAVIDAALAGITDAQGRKWLDFYRAKAR